jgi:monofunctional biosynthetic peptidoglycan transglycosylase
MKNYFKRTIQIIKWAVFIFFSSTILIVMFYRFINPPLTPLMVIRYFQQDEVAGEKHIIKKWKALEQISPKLVLAVVAAEDNNFPKHWGFDWDAIFKAMKHNKNAKIVHGASTITQQTAKNLFLWPSRSYIRKGLEFYFTALIEICWSKERIMEVYLNIIEMGKGVYGAEAASQLYFHKSALKLTTNESALLAAILPRPLKRNPAKPTPYLISRQFQILELMSGIGKVEL